MIRFVILSLGVILTLFMMAPLLTFLYDSLHGNFANINFSVKPLNVTHIVYEVNITYLNKIPIYNLNVKISFITNENTTIAYGEFQAPVVERNQTIPLRIIAETKELKMAKYVLFSISGYISNIYYISINIKNPLGV